MTELAPPFVLHDYPSGNRYGRTAWQAARASGGITGQRIVATAFADHGPR